MGGYFPTLKSYACQVLAVLTVSIHIRNRCTGRRDRAMIALLFALLTATMGLNFLGKRTAADALFFVTLAMSVYWLKFHATSELTIQL